MTSHGSSNPSKRSIRVRGVALALLAFLIAGCVVEPAPYYYGGPYRYHYYHDGYYWR